MQQKEPKQQNESDKKLPNIWEVLAERKKKGLWDGEVEVIQTKEFNITKGDHYYVVEDPKNGFVRCTSCQVPHGGVLEAHLLSRYRVENGVIYLDGKATNAVPTK